MALAAGLTALADQASKTCAHDFLRARPSQPLIDGFLYVTYVRNTGAAFGLLRNSAWLLSALSLVFLLAVIIFGATSSPLSRGTRLALAAGIGGAVSNLLDRFTRGYVIDFIDFRVWPVFNLADVAIVVGLGWLCFRLLFHGQAPGGPGGRRRSEERTDDNVP
jgi:signal peptidase II